MYLFQQKYFILIVMSALSPLPTCPHNIHLPLVEKGHVQNCENSIRKCRR